MFASIVSAQACDCFTVIATDLRTWKRIVFPMFLDFKDAGIKALEYQALMDPSRKLIDFRIHQRC